MKIQHSMFALRARPNGLAEFRVAVAAPRSLGGAVVRNRSRRRLREAFRAAIGELQSRRGCDLVIVARPQTGSAVFADLRKAAGVALGSVAERAVAR